MAEEISFPRGGIRSFSSSKKSEENDDLFQTKNEKPKEKKRNKGKKKKFEENEDDKDVVVIDSLNHQTIVPNLIVIGCVHKVFNYSVEFSLPGGILGTVPITNMPTSYVELLKRYTENPENYDESLLTMPNMFKVGDCYPVKVVDYSLTESSSKTQIILSLNPKDINDDLISHSLFHGMILLSAVTSIEDHGYIIDVGIKGLSGFLSSKNASHHIQKVNKGRELTVGEILHVAINMPELDENPFEGRNLTLTTKKKYFDMDISEKITLQNILPGMTLSAIITEATRDGLAVKCLNYNGCIYRDNLNKPFDDPLKYTLGQEIKAMVLFKHPLTQVIHLTLVPKPLSDNIRTRFGNIQVGDKFDKVEIVEVHPHAVHLKLSENVKGIAKTPHLFDKEVENAADLLSIGDSIACRVLSLNYIDKIVRVSLKKSVLKQAFIENESIKAGDIVKGVVRKVDSIGIVVKLGLYVQGYIHSSHLSDIPISHPEKHFHVGGEVTCRVLKLDKKEGGSSHFLTCKKSLVNSKISPLTSLDDVSEGMIFDGFILRASSKGLLISFYNDIKGWVPVSEISTSYIEFPEKVFYVGQVVKCRVLSFSPITKNLKLSLKLTTRKSIGKKNLGEKHDLNVGDVISVKITDKNEKGMDVLILPNETLAYIPLMHISDHPHLCKILLQNYSVGDIVENCCIFNLKGTIICTMKALFLKASARGKMVSKISQIQESETYPGVIKGFLSYGILVEMGNNVVGLVHKRKIANVAIRDPGLSGLVTHQSLIVKVLKLIDHNGTKRIELSSRLLDVLPTKNVWKLALDSLESYLKDWNKIGDLVASNESEDQIGALKPGQIVNVEVTKVTNEGLLCRLKDLNVKGMVILNNIGATLRKEGEKCQGLVLHVDFPNQCVELSLCHRLVKQRAKLNNNENAFLKQIKKLSSHKCQILLVRQHFALATLLDHTYGILVYLPINRHPNDTVGNMYSPGQKTHLIAHRVRDTYVIGVLETHEKQATKDDERFRNKEKVENEGMTIKAINNNNKRKAIEPLKEESVKKKSKIKNKINPGESLAFDEVKQCSDEPENGHDTERDLKVSDYKIGDTVQGKISCTLFGKVYVEIGEGKTGFFRVNDSLENEKQIKLGKTLKLKISDILNDEIEFLVPNLTSRKVFWAKVGQTLEGTVSHFNREKLFVKFSNNKFGFAFKNKMNDDHLSLPLGTKVTVKVLQVDNCEVSVRILEVPEKLSNAIIKDSPLKHQKEEAGFIAGDVLEGSVLYFRKGATFVQLAPKRIGIISKTANPDILENLKTGSKVLVRILKVKDKGFDLKLLKKVEDCTKEILTVLEVPIVNEDIEMEIPKDVPRLQLQDSFVWDVDATPNLSTVVQTNLASDSSSDNDEDNEKPVKMKRKKGERLKEEEEALRKQEERLMDLNRAPETIDDFERLILSSPDNSMIWLKYMAYHLQQTEIDKARAIAQRALKTISFREESEKLNVWIALLNLENMYGTRESLDEVFTRALEFNEPLKVYRQMINIYVETSKTEEAEELHQTIIKKYCQDPTGWTDFGLFYMKSDKQDLARKLMERSFKSLDKRHHIELISKFAQMEFNYGDPERGKTLFKNVLNNFPKRTDIWSVFVDVLVKHGDYEEARQNLEKLSSSSLQMKKMKFVFKKYLDFEKNHGSEENIEKVKLKALEYVQNSNLVK